MITTVVTLCRNEPDYWSEWLNSWSRHGWTPRLVTEHACTAHPDFEKWLALAAGLPSVNGRDYFLWCWLRWLGYGNEPCVMVDLDTINYGWTPDDLAAMKQPEGSLLFLDEVDVVGNPQQVREELLAAISQTVPDLSFENRPNMMDMIVFRTIHKRWPVSNISLQLLDPGWEAAKIVHFQMDRCLHFGCKTKLEAIHAVNAAKGIRR